MKKFILSYLIIMITLIAGCHDDEEPLTPPLASDTTSVGSSIELKGYVQKGPFINGTSMIITELDDSLVATGKTFTTQITDNKGSFSIKTSPLNFSTLQMIASGFYFDEVKGEKSAAQLTLFALADISENALTNVNLLSHLEFNRVAYLIQKEEKDIKEAKKQAQQEILSTFDIDMPEMRSSELLDISQDGEDNAILLAISAILQANNTVAELSELLANISTDLREDGRIDSEIILVQLKEQATLLNMPQIRINLENRYTAMGLEATIPNFEQYIDSDGDGILNKDEDDTPEEFSFTSQENVATSTELFSNEITLTGLKEEGASDAHATQSTLFINGKAMQDSVVQVRNGDKIKLQITSSSQYADTTVASLSIGTLTRNFTVITDDYLPEAFSFMNQKDVAVDSWYTSDTITVRGLPYPTPTTIDNGIIVKNGIELTTDTTSIITGDKLAIKLLSHQEYYSSTSSILSINGIEAPFQLTTDNYTPDEFSFTSIKNAKRDSVYTSEPITISGLPHPTPIDIDRGTLLINGKLSGTNALVISGDQIAVKLTASSDYETALSSSIQIGASYHTISITTGLNPWQKITEGPIGITIGSFVINNKIYLIELSTMILYQYDPDKDEWSAKGTYPGEKGDSPIAFAMEDKGFIGLGGEYIYDAESDTQTYKSVRDFWEYDPKTNQWAKKADFPGENVAGATSFIINSKAYLATGYYWDYGSEKYPDELYQIDSKQLWEYSPLDDQWIRRSDFPGKARNHAAGFSYNDKGYIGGGQWGIETSGLGDFWMYDPVSDSWSEAVKFNNELSTLFEADYYGSSGACSFFTIHESLYFVKTLNTLYFKEYDSTRNLWEDLELPKNEYAIGAVMAGKERGYIYFSPTYTGAPNPVLYKFTPPQD